MIDSERKLWAGLRGEQLGVKFRRQHPLGSHVADLALPSNAPLVNMEGVLTTISEQLKLLAGDAPTPALPQRGREKDTP